MKTREGRLINARFANLECNMIRCEFKDYERPEGDNLSVQMHHYNPENKFVKQILAEYTEEDLERNYVQFSKMETLRKQMFEKFVERFDEIIDYLDSGTPAQEVVEKEITLQSIRDLGNNSEAFFKLKLYFFKNHFKNISGADVKIPSLYILGKFDKYVPPSSVRHHFSQIPRSVPKEITEFPLDHYALWDAEFVGKIAQEIGVFFDKN